MLTHDALGVFIKADEGESLEGPLPPLSSRGQPGTAALAGKLWLQSHTFDLLIGPGGFWVTSQCQLLLTRFGF